MGGKRYASKECLSHLLLLGISTAGLQDVGEALLGRRIESGDSCPNVRHRACSFVQSSYEDDLAVRISAAHRGTYGQSARVSARRAGVRVRILCSGGLLRHLL